LFIYNRNIFKATWFTKVCSFYCCINKVLEGNKTLFFYIQPLIYTIREEAHKKGTPLPPDLGALYFSSIFSFEE